MTFCRSDQPGMRTRYAQIEPLAIQMCPDVSHQAFNQSNKPSMRTRHAHYSVFHHLTCTTQAWRWFVKLQTFSLKCSLSVAWSAGTVANVREASLWLSYTYLFVRMLRNPLAYGVGWEELTADPRLEGRR